MLVEEWKYYSPLTSAGLQQPILVTKITPKREVAGSLPIARKPTKFGTLPLLLLLLFFTSRRW
jgi:hypothetical protein